jgi:hypothetical protein
MILYHNLYCVVSLWCDKCVDESNKIEGKTALLLVARFVDTCRRDGIVFMECSVSELVVSGVPCISDFIALWGGANDWLNRDTILEAEFNYVAQTVFQNHEDRANATTFYLVAIGSLVAALLSSGENGLKGEHVDAAFAGLFFLLGLGGVRTLFELARLRHAWFDSVITMNAIKEYYIKHFDTDPEFAAAFKWRKLPPRYKVGSVSFLIALQTAFMSSLMFGATLAFVVRDRRGDFGGTLIWLAYVILLLAGFGVELAVYRRKVREEKQPNG